MIQTLGYPQGETEHAQKMAGGPLSLKKEKENVQVSKHSALFKLSLCGHTAQGTADPSPI